MSTDPVSDAEGRLRLELRTIRVSTRQALGHRDTAELREEVRAAGLKLLGALEAKARSHGGSELILRDIAAVRAEIGTMEGPDDLTA